MIATIAILVLAFVAVVLIESFWSDPPGSKRKKRR